MSLPSEGLGRGIETIDNGQPVQQLGVGQRGSALLRLAIITADEVAVRHPLNKGANNDESGPRFDTADVQDVLQMIAEGKSNLGLMGTMATMKTARTGYRHMSSDISEGGRLIDAKEFRKGFADEADTQGIDPDKLSVKGALEIIDSAPNKMLVLPLTFRHPNGGQRTVVNDALTVAGGERVAVHNTWQRHSLIMTLSNDLSNRGVKPITADSINEYPSGYANDPPNLDVDSTRVEEDTVFSRLGHLRQRVEPINSGDNEPEYEPAEEFIKRTILNSPHTDYRHREEIRFGETPAKAVSRVGADERMYRAVREAFYGRIFPHFR